MTAIADAGAGILDPRTGTRARSTLAREQVKVCDIDSDDLIHRALGRDRPRMVTTGNQCLARLAALDAVVDINAALRDCRD